MKTEIAIEATAIRSSYSAKGEMLSIVSVLAGWVCVAGMMTSGFYIWA